MATGSMFALCSLSGYWCVSLLMSGRYVYSALMLFPFVYTGTALTVQFATPTKIISAMGVRSNGRHLRFQSLHGKLDIAEVASVRRLTLEEVRKAAHACLLYTSPSPRDS